MGKIKVAVLVVIGGILLFVIGRIFATGYFLAIVDGKLDDSYKLC